MIKSKKGADSTKRERESFTCAGKVRMNRKKHQDDDEGVAVGMKRAGVVLWMCSLLLLLGGGEGIIISKECKQPVATLWPKEKFEGMSVLFLGVLFYF